MDDILHNSQLIDELIAISKEAGEAILKVYNSDFDYQIKEDLSPLTKADTLSNDIICERLKTLTPDIPILSEENSDIPFNIRSSWEQYWLVDPLDGTKEFIKKNGEFTTNIAFIYQNRPIFGMIYVPASNEVFWGSKEIGAYHLSGDSYSNKKKIRVSKKKAGGELRIVSSRSHPSVDLKTLLDKIGIFKLVSVGSSLKFCLIAQGLADCYPRLGPTSEWDTAAGEIIAESAGANIVNLENKIIKYNQKEDYLNPHFLVSNSIETKEEIFSII